jgi:hypothetical protein
MAEPWEGPLDVIPRTAESSKVRVATYYTWFPVCLRVGNMKKRAIGYPLGMPSCNKHTGGIPFESCQTVDASPNWCTPV